MMGLHFMKQAPFPTVYIHALVRDAKGAKMSKSKGNVIDPLGLIDEYGADALRFTLAAMAAQGRDIKLAPQRVEGYRNFATKLWNASRFAEMNACELPPNFDATATKETLNRWIAHETSRAIREVTEAIEAYRFNDAAGAIYRFVWNVYCDWYLELAKPLLMGEESAAKAETRAMVAWARDEILKLLHPFMPFITEELWAVTAERAGLLTLAPWSRKPAELTPEQLAFMSATGPADVVIPPELFSFVAAEFSDPAAEAEIGWVVDLVTAVRSVRAEMNITPATLTPLLLVAASAETKQRAQRWSDVVNRMARLSDISFADAAPDGAVQLLVRGEVAALPLKGVIDLGARAGPARQGTGQSRRRHQARRRQARQREVRRQCARGNRRGRKRKARRRGGAQGKDRRGAGAAQEGAVTQPNVNLVGRRNDRRGTRASISN